MEKYFLGIEVEINHHCNKACSYCPNSLSKRKETGHFSDELFELLLSQLQDINYKGRVSFHFYNEPLLSPNLEEYVYLTKNKLPETYIDIFTNGTLLTEKRFRKLIEAGVDKFTVTKHENSKRYVFDETYKNLSDEDKKAVKYQQHEKLIFTNRGGILDGVGFHKKDPPFALPCFIPMSSLVVTVDGNIIPCYEDFDQKNEMGNIKDTHIKDIWNSEGYRHFRNSLKEGRRAMFDVCKTCNNLNIIQ